MLSSLFDDVEILTRIAHTLENPLRFFLRHIVILVPLAQLLPILFDTGEQAPAVPDQYESAGVIG